MTGKKEHTQQWHKPCITIGTCKNTVIAFEIVYTDFILMNSHISSNLVYTNTHLVDRDKLLITAYMTCPVARVDVYTR